MSRPKNPIKLPAKYKSTRSFKIRNGILVWEGNYDNSFCSIPIINTITDTPAIDMNGNEKFRNVAKRKLHDYLYNTLVDYDYRLFEKVKNNSHNFIKE